MCFVECSVWWKCKNMGCAYWEVFENATCSLRPCECCPFQQGWLIDCLKQLRRSLVSDFTFVSIFKYANCISYETKLYIYIYYLLTAFRCLTTSLASALLGTGWVCKAPCNVVHPSSILWHSFLLWEGVLCWTYAQENTSLHLWQREHYALLGPRTVVSFACIKGEHYAFASAKIM